MAIARPAPCFSESPIASVPQIMLFAFMHASLESFSDAPYRATTYHVLQCRRALREIARPLGLWRDTMIVGQFTAIAM
jgi:hypothetical protein